MKRLRGFCTKAHLRCKAASAAAGAVPLTASPFKGENRTGKQGTFDFHTANPLLYSQIGQHGAKRRLRNEF